MCTPWKKGRKGAQEEPQSPAWLKGLDALLTRPPPSPVLLHPGHPSWFPRPPSDPRSEDHGSSGFRGPQTAAIPWPGHLQGQGLTTSSLGQSTMCLWTIGANTVSHKSLQVSLRCLGPS